MKSSLILATAILLTSVASQAAEIHRIAREGSIFDMNVKLDEDGMNLLKLDEQDENGLTVWDNARLNPQAVQMIEFLAAFQEQEHDQFERAYQVQLELEQAYPQLVPEDQRIGAGVQTDEIREEHFILDEDFRPAAYYDHFWGVAAGQQVFLDNPDPHENTPDPMNLGVSAHSLFSSLSSSG